MKELRFILILGLLFIGSIALRAENRPRVVLITSDASVEKYREAQEEFKKAIARPVLEVHLEEKKWDLAQVEEFLYDEHPDVTYCIGSKAYLLANKFLSDRAIIFSSIINWQRLPLPPKSYGVSNELHTEMHTTLFRYLFPGIKTIGVLYSEKYNKEWFEKTKGEAGRMGVTIVGRPVAKAEHAIAALQELIPHIQALWLVSEPVVITDTKVLNQVFTDCEAKKIPVFSYHEAFVKYGATLIISVDNPTVGRQAAGIANEVLSGEKIEERVQLPAGSYIILNSKKVKEYGLDFNEQALGAVNEIIR